MPFPEFAGNNYYYLTDLHQLRPDDYHYEIVTWSSSALWTALTPVYARNSCNLNDKNIQTQKYYNKLRLSHNIASSWGRGGRKNRTVGNRKFRNWTYLVVFQFCPVSKCDVNWILSCLDSWLSFQFASELSVMFTPQTGLDKAVQYPIYCTVYGYGGS